MLRSNKTKIIIVGYKSFIQENLYTHLEKKFKVKKIQFKNINFKIIKNFDIIINCSNSKNFFNKKYKKKNDRNLQITNLIKNSKIRLIIFSSRQVYSPKLNINENSKLRPLNIYAKNCIKSETFCRKQIKKQLLILRLSNIFGYEIGNKKKESLTSLIIKGIRKKKVVFDENYFLYKDFLPIKILCVYIEKLIKKKSSGVFNVGSGIPLSVKSFVHKIIDEKKIKLIINKKKINDNNFSFNTTKLQKKTCFSIGKKMLNFYIGKLKKQIND